MERLRRRIDPKECYIVSPPKSSAATRDGKPTEVQRGDIRLFVAFRPGENVSNEVSFTGGYPFREGSTVTLTVGADSFTLSPGSGDAGEWAWTDPADDSKVVAALRRGATAKLDRHLVARHRHRGHLLARGLHRRGRGRGGALPVGAPPVWPLPAGNRYVAARPAAARPMAAAGRSRPTVVTLPRRPAAAARPNVVGMSRAALRAALVEAGTPEAQATMRVAQVWQWLYHRGARDFDGDDQPRPRPTASCWRRASASPGRRS